MTAEEFLEGRILLIDKPLQWSSFQAVNKLKWALKKHRGLKNIKIGHAGTLDPLATGLLIICTGKFTKRIPELQGMTKEYTGTFHLGATTPSFDLETEVDRIFPTDHIDIHAATSALNGFLGEIDQKPPIFSAIKKDGKRLYEHARKGQEVEIAFRKIHIYDFEITRFELPEIDFRVSCSKGTYIRSLAYDYGMALNSGAYLAGLRRTRIGDFDVNEAKSIEDFVNELTDSESIL